MGTCAMTGLTPEHAALLAEFVAEEMARGRRSRGVDSLRKGARLFLRFVEELGKSARDVRLSDAYAYQGMLLERSTQKGTPYSRQTIADRVRMASVFCAYLARTGTLLDNPFQGVRRVRYDRKIPTDILKEREMAALLAELANFRAAGDLWLMKKRYLAHVVAELQYASGLRIAEAAALRPEDVDVERALVYVRSGKQGSNRIGFLTDYAACVLESFMRDVRPLLGRKYHRHGRACLFMTTFDPLRNLVNEELELACGRIKVPVITSHGFRRALGYHLLRSGCALRYIQAILGHKHIRHTEVYTKVDAEDVKRVFDECHPRMTL